MGNYRSIKTILLGEKLIVAFFELVKVLVKKLPQWGLTRVYTYQVRIHSFVLMNNHWHLLVQTPLANLSEFMRRLNITYTSHYNRRHMRVGHLYQGRYRSFLVEEDGYLNMVSRYIHLNPVRISSMKEVELKKRLEYLYGYKWSSLRGYVEADHELDWVEYEMVLADYGQDRNSAAESYRRHLFEDIKSDLSIKGDIVGQSVLGSESFVARIKQKYLERPKDRERPAIAKINKHISLDQVLAIVGEETGQRSLFEAKGGLRQIVMDVLYTYAGLNNREIGELFGVDYSTISQNRKRLTERLAKESQLAILMQRIAVRMSRIKI
jgi:putative transposase